MKLNKHIIKETQFDSAKPCSNTILAINFLVQILIKAGGNQTRDLKFWDVFPYFPKYGKDVAKNDKIGQKPPKKVAGRRRTSQGVAENVAGRRRKRRRRRRGRRRTSQGVFFWPKLSFSQFFCPNWAKPWLELVSDTLLGSKHIEDDSSILYNIFLIFCGLAFQNLKGTSLNFKGGSSQYFEGSKVRILKIF